MQIPLTSMEQLMPFPTAQGLLAKDRKPLDSVSPGTTVLAALQMMTGKNIRFLAVLDNGKLAGVISERDCARRVILGKLDAGSTTVCEIMSTNVHSVSPDSKIPECIMLMYAKDVGYLPVLRGGELMGVLSIRTLLAVTGLTHKDSYGDIFAITVTKFLAVFLIIGVYYLTGIY